MTVSLCFQPGSRTIFVLGLLLIARLSGAEAGAVSRPTVQVNAGDDQAITAALAALPATGGIVQLGAGTFAIRHPVIIDRDGIELRGQGTATILTLAAHANCPVLVLGSASTPTLRLVRQIVVQNLLIDGNRTEQDMELYAGNSTDPSLTALRNNGITIRGAEAVQVRDVVTRHARSGGVVLEKFCRGISIDGLESYENEFDGLAAYETEESRFTKLNLHHNRSAGFSFDWRFNHNHIADTSASDNGSQGIFMRDSIGNTFERLTLRANGEQGIFMGETRSIPGTACRYNKFRMLTITANKTQGIRINDASCNPNTLDHSMVTGNGSEDISLADLGQLEIIEAGTAQVLVAGEPQPASSRSVQ